MIEKHLFIINPEAGGVRKKCNELARSISEAAEACGVEYEIYFTTGPLDATEKVRHAAGSLRPLRVYACGGDGTLNECANGAVGKPHVAVTHFPSGTGNDFIRMFGAEANRFREIKELIHGEVHPIDVIECNGRYSFNICSVGIDARVGADVHKYSRLPLIGGAAGYVTSLAVNVLRGINSRFSITVNGEILIGMFALICACNGRYYGGGFNPVPEARPDDGIIDVLVVKEIALHEVARLLGIYAKGGYKKIPEKVTHIRSDYLQLESDHEFVINIDGEQLYSKKAYFKMLPGAVNFVFPRSMDFFKDCAMKGGEFASKS